MDPLIGVLFHWLCGLASGSFYVPYRMVRNWSWETYWLVGGFFAWLAAPWVFALLLTHDPCAAIKAAELKVIFQTYLCGVCWGLGGLTFGLTMRYLGMSLGMAIALGYCTAFGTLIPPIVKGTFERDVFTPAHGKLILLGILVCLVGIIITGKAGLEKEKGMSEDMKRATVKEFDFKKGLLIATFSGIMSAFFAFGFAAGDPIYRLTLAQGNLAAWSGLPVLIVILAGGFTTNFVWCSLLNLRNRTGYEYLAVEQRAPFHRQDQSAIENPTDTPAEEMAGQASAPGSPADCRIPRGSNYLFSGMAGVIWYLQFFFYQIGESKMGDYKFSSWTLHMASIIIFSSLWGIGLGEWRGSNARAHRLLFLGLAMLITSTIVVGLGNYLGSKTAH